MSKKQIYLFCDTGMSTGTMVNKTVEVVEKHQMPLMVTTFPIARTQEVIETEKPAAILLRPQVRFLLEKTKEQFTPQRIPVAAVAPEIYGMVDGGRASREALRLVKQNKK